MSLFPASLPQDDGILLRTERKLSPLDQAKTSTAR